MYTGAGCSLNCLTSHNHACSKASGPGSSRSHSARCDIPRTWHTSHARTVHWRAGGSGPRWETRTLHTPHLLPHALMEKNRTGVGWQDTNKCAMRDSIHTHYSILINRQRLSNDTWIIKALYVVGSIGRIFTVRSGRGGLLKTWLVFFCFHSVPSFFGVLTEDQQHNKENSHIQRHNQMWWYGIIVRWL